MTSESLVINYAKRHYQLILWVIIVIFLINEAVTFSTYKDHIVTADIINQAGRQRMYSQKIAKLALYYINGDRFVIQELQETVTRWSITHRSFMDENSSLSKFYHNSSLIKINFDELNQSHRAIEKAINQIVANPQDNHANNVAIVMEHERRFLVLMDTIVNQMESESGRLYYRSTMFEIIIGTVTVLGLFFVIYLLLVPTINDLRTKERVLGVSISEKKALLSEIHHRVKNNLAIISGIFQLQIMNKDYSPATFESAITRVQSIASIHEFLYKEEEFGSVKIDHYIAELIKRLSESHSRLGHQIKVHVISEEIVFDMEKAVPFSLLLNELVTNSLKHAFQEGDIGQIKIILAQDDDGTVHFCYQDNGRGTTCSMEGKNGIGMKLIEALSDQLESKLEISYTPSFALKGSFMAD